MRQWENLIMTTANIINLDAETVYLDDAARTAALGCCMAAHVYHLSLAHGSARWSGADLHGKASKFSGRYKDSRDNLVQRWRLAGLRVMFVAGPNDRTVAVVASEDFALAVVGKRADRVGHLLAYGSTNRMVDGRPVSTFAEQVEGGRVYKVTRGGMTAASSVRKAC